MALKTHTRKATPRHTRSRHRPQGVLHRAPGMEITRSIPTQSCRHPSQLYKMNAVKAEEAGHPAVATKAED